MSDKLVDKWDIYDISHKSLWESHQTKLDYEVDYTLLFTKRLIESILGYCKDNHYKEFDFHAFGLDSDGFVTILGNFYCNHHDRMLSDSGNSCEPQARNSALMH